MKPLRRLALPCIVIAMSLPAAAQSTWTWTGASGPSWANTGNWNPATVPDPGANIIISNTTNNGVGNLTNLDRVVNKITFGNTGTRTSTFTVNTGTQKLTIAGGIQAEGEMGNNAALTLRGNFVVSANQEWSTAGTPSGDNGIFPRGANDTANTVPSGSFTLDANLTKTGSGQLVLAATQMSGSGNLIVSGGRLKLNAGSNQPLIVGGPGNITLNGTSNIEIVKNSGTLNVSRAIVLNDTALMTLRTATVDVASPIAFNGTHILDLNNVSNLSGAWTGSGTVTRSGSGTLNLNGSLSGFAGTLNLTAGTNNLAGDLGGDLSVTGGSATLAGGVAGNVNVSAATATLGGPVGGSLTVSDGATVSGEATATGNLSISNSTIGANPTTPQSLGTTGNLELSGSNTVMLTGNPSSTAPFAVLTYSGSLTGGAANLALGGDSSGYRGFAFDDSTPGVITLAITSASRTWTGAAGTVWDVNNTTNWQEGDQKFYQLDTVTFGDTGAGTVAITGSLMPGSITVNTNNDYDFTAEAGNSIGGATGITKIGDGVLSLGGVNSFTGNITVHGGVLKPTGNQALGANGNTITIAAGATLDTNGSMNATRNYHAVIAGDGVDGFGAIVNSGANHLNGFGSITLTADATIGGIGRWDLRPLVAGEGVLNLAGHTLTKTDFNKISIVDSSATAAGSINIEDGTLAITRSHVSGNGTVTVTPAGVLQFENNSTGSFSKPIVLDGGTIHSISNVTLAPVSSPVTLVDYATFLTEADLTLAGSLTGSGDFIKNGTAALILAGDATHTGSTFVSAGTLQIGAGGTTGSIAGDIDNFGNVAFNRSDNFTFGHRIFGSGSFTKQGAGTLTLTNAASTWTGEKVVAGGRLVVASPTALGDTAGFIRFTGSTGILDLATNTSIAAYPLTIGAGNSGTIHSNVATPGNGINHTLGNFELSNVTLTVAAGDNVTGGDPRVTIPNFSASAGSAGTVTLNPTTAGLTVGTASIGSGNFAKSLQLGGTSRENLVSGTISDGINVLTLRKVNDSLWTLTGDNTFTGNVAVVDGALVLAHSNALGTADKIIFVNGEASQNNYPELRLTGGISPTVAEIQTSGAGEASVTGALRNMSGSNTLNITSQLSLRTGIGATTLYSDAGTLTINTPLVTAINTNRELFLDGPGNGVINGVIANGTTANLPVTKKGSGTWTLNGAHTYTGATTVSAGILSFGQAALNDNAAVVIAAGAKLNLNFSGTDRVGSLTIDGVPKPDGLYSAATDPDFITGTGSIRVGPEPVGGYGSWASGYPFTPGVNDGALDDPDGDGVNNLLEYVLGGTPIGTGAGDTSTLPAQTLTPTDLVLTFRRSDASEADVTLKVQWSDNMTTWNDFATIGATSSLPQVQVTEDSPTPELDTIVVTIPRSLAPGGKIFARLQAVK